MKEIKQTQEPNYDQEFVNGVASRVFRMCGGPGNIDFNIKNHNQLDNPGELKCKWKTIRKYNERFNGISKDIWW